MIHDGLLYILKKKYVTIRKWSTPLLHEIQEGWLYLCYFHMRMPLSVTCPCLYINCTISFKIHTVRWSLTKMAWSMSGYIWTHKFYSSLVFSVSGYAWAEDKEHCEEYGRMLQADPGKVSSRAKKRGLPQVSGKNKTFTCFEMVIPVWYLLMKLLSDDNNIPYILRIETNSSCQDYLLKKLNHFLYRITFEKIWNLRVSEKKRSCDLYNFHVSEISISVGNSGSRQPLCWDTGGGRDLQ